MKIGIIAPINYLNLCITDLHLCYAGITHYPRYLNYYKQKSKSEVVILDSAPDLPRKYFPSETLFEVAKYILPAVVILPSVDYSWDRTVGISQSFYRKYQKKLKSKLVGILQGVDLASLSRCYSGLKEISDIIGLPSPLEKIARRDEIIRDLGITETTLYLEVYSNPFEEIPMGNTIGICTSFPVRLAQDLRELDEFIPTPPPLDFNLQEGKLLEELAIRNVKEYLEVVNEGNKG